MSTLTLDRVTAEIARESEYFDVKELQIQTGQPAHNFLDVIVKELFDNALDAVETVGKSPEIIFNVYAEEEKNKLKIYIKDNGPGLKPELLNSILDYSIRVSDKVNYRSPTRGAQGNALKTIFGIPFALAKEAGKEADPIIIEACGKRYVISAWINPLGRVCIEKNEEEIGETIGTSFEISIYFDYYRYDIPPLQEWCYKFAVFNPHFSVKFFHFKRNSEIQQGNSEEWILVKNLNFYQKFSFPNEWKKFSPSDLTFIQWYDFDIFQKLLYSYIYSSNGKSNITLRDFVRQFKGLTATKKAKEICDNFPGVFRLKDLEGKKEEIKQLLDCMKDNTKPASSKVLGFTGKDHFEKFFKENFNIYPDRFFYCRREGITEGLPYTIEAVAGQGEKEGLLFHGINFSHTFEDPLCNNDFSFRVSEVSSNSLSGFVRSCYCLPGYTDVVIKNVSIALHIITPYFEVLDRGKTRLKVSREMAKDISEALWSVCKKFYEEGKRKEKDYIKAKKMKEKERKRRLREERFLEVSQKEAVYQTLPQAVKNASSDGDFPFSVRNLYYAIRPLIQPLIGEIDYDYFKSVLIEYQRECFPIKNLYYDPRGYLLEPHTKKEIPLGTREVADYTFPYYLYNKILYVEKRGLMPIFQSKSIPEKYDMAIVAGEGYPTVAIRELFARASKKENYKLFVLHDADFTGYNIARTLKEETERMPEHNIDVIDMGLMVKDVLEMGLPFEEFTRVNNLPSGLCLNEIEKEFFNGVIVMYRGHDEKKKPVYKCKRVELNEMRPEMLIKFVERKLEEHKATIKVIPPDEVLKERLESRYRKFLEERIKTQISYILDTSDLIPTIKEKIKEEYSPDIPDVKKQLSKNTYSPWEDIGDGKMSGFVNKSLEKIDFKKEVIEFLKAKEVTNYV